MSLSYGALQLLASEHAYGCFVHQSREGEVMVGATRMIEVYDQHWNRVLMPVVKVTHHTDAGYRYSRVHHKCPDGRGGWFGETFTMVQGHWGVKG